MNKSLWPAIKLGVWRFIRVSVAVLVAYWATQVGNDPKWLALAPILAGLSKWLRDEFGIDVKII